MTEAKTTRDRSTQGKQGDGRWGRTRRSQKTLDSPKLSSKAKRGQRAGSTSTGSADGDLLRKARRHGIVSKVDSLCLHRRTNVQVRPRRCSSRWYPPCDDAPHTLTGPTCSLSCRAYFFPPRCPTIAAFLTLGRSLNLHDSLESWIRLLIGCGGGG